MLIHGGDTAGYMAEFGRQPIDFSANVSPLGLPPKVRQAAIDGLDLADQYPDPLCRQLREAIASHENCYVNQVFCGNGAADVIYRLVQAVKPRKALLPAPTFAEYGLALSQTQCQISYFYLNPEQNFAISDDILDYIDETLDILFVCQPNNPTAAVCPKERLIRILKRCEETNTLLVLDACFTEFLDNFQEYSLQSHLKSPNLVILKAFTKLYAMAGLRLGYCLSANETLLENMALAGQPWAVSCVAQKAGVAALQEHDYVNSLRAFLRTERAFLETNLGKMGCCVYPPSANFIFFRSVADLDIRLREKGILIRNCANYEGLTSGYFRVAVRTHPENLRLLEAVQEVLSWENP